MKKDLENLLNSSNEAIIQAIANVNLEEDVEIDLEKLFKDYGKVLRKGNVKNDEVGRLFN